MRFFTFDSDAGRGLGLSEDGKAFGLTPDHDDYPGPLLSLLASGDGALREAANVLRAHQLTLDWSFAPVIPNPAKIICVGLNYSEHTEESGYEQPAYPTLFPRFASSLIAHEAPMIRPAASDTLDFEGEIAAVIGAGGRHIAKADALAHVAGYALFNDGSVREYQFVSPQWTVGKNFDDTGAFGPYFVTADALPLGARGLRLETRLNGEIVQSASTDQMVFDVATLVSTISEAIMLEPGDVIVTGTPSGIGHARDPKLYMKPGDVIEVEVEGLDILRNPIRQEAGPAKVQAAE